MDDQLSFPGMEAASSPAPAGPREIDLSLPPRLRLVDRSQARFMPCSLDQTLPPEHDARLVWDFVGSLPMKVFEDKVVARGSAPGRPATDPRILLTLWIYAGIRGIGNGREVDRLVHCDDGFRWIAGGVSLDYHIINDFRVAHEDAFEHVFITTVVALVRAGLVEVTRLAQDGVRIRASAGSDSFRRDKSLKELLEDARAHLAALKKQTEKEYISKKEAKQLADANDRVKRLEHAAALLPELQESMNASAKKRCEKPGEARVSTTDPDARRMQMPDGGTRPAYNVQLAADVKSRAIVGVDVTSDGTDYDQATPMREQVEKTTGVKVKEHLIDGGYASLKTIDEGEKAGTTMYAPVSKKCQNRNPDADPYARKKNDTDEIYAWRTRMNTDEAKAIYKQRGSTIETINGDLTEHRGLRRLRVRGPTKVRCVVLLLALVYNLRQFENVLIAAMIAKKS